MEGPKPLHFAMDSIQICQEPQSDRGDEGVKQILPRDERGCVNGEVVGDLVIAKDNFPNYIVGPVRDTPKPTLGPSVPCCVRFSQWVEAHRGSCGFDNLKPSGSRKWFQSPNSYQHQPRANFSERSHLAIPCTRSPPTPSNMGNSPKKARLS